MPKILNGTQNVLDILNANGLFDQLWNYVGKDNNKPLPAETITEVLGAIINGTQTVGVAKNYIDHEGNISNIEIALNTMSIQECDESEINIKRESGIYWITGGLSRSFVKRLMVVVDDQVYRSQYLFCTDGTIQHRYGSYSGTDWTEWSDIGSLNLKNGEAIESIVQGNELTNWNPKGVNDKVVEYIENNKFNKNDKYIQTKEGEVIAGAFGEGSAAFGTKSQALGNKSLAEGSKTIAFENNSHAEGNGTFAAGKHSHTEGNGTTSFGEASHAEGLRTIAGIIDGGQAAHAEGIKTQAIGEASHAEGLESKAIGEVSHVEGRETLAEGKYSHAEGAHTSAVGENAHAEGGETIAEGDNTHAEGYKSSAIGKNSHAEGSNTSAEGNNSHAEGAHTIASGLHSHAEGLETIATASSQHVQGRYNIEDTEKKYAHIVGNGQPIPNDVNGDVIRSNAHTLDWEGNAWFAGGISFGKENPMVLNPGDGKESLQSSTSQALSDYDIALGQDNISGLKGYYIKSIDTKNKKIYLSKVKVDAAIESTNNTDSFFGTPRYDINKSFSMIVKDGENRNHYHFCATIRNIENNVVEYDGELPFSTLLNEENPSTNTFFVPSQSAIGHVTISCGSYSEGYDNNSAGNYSHVEGRQNIAAGSYSHAEGRYTSAGYAAHAEGEHTMAKGYGSHAEGYETKAISDYSHAEGYFTQAKGYGSHVEGNTTEASGQSAHAEGDYTKATGSESHAEGGSTKAIGIRSHAEGNQTRAEGNYSHVEGYRTVAEGAQSHAEGLDSKTTAPSSHAEGNGTIASGDSSHAEGFESKATAPRAHAEGWKTEASGYNSHAEGNITIANGDNSHSEGYGTKAQSSSSHAEGYWTEAFGVYSHSEGADTKSIGEASHAEGYKSIANNLYSHAEGEWTEANGEASHAEGRYTTAEGKAQHVQGRYNIKDTENKYAHIVGNGEKEDEVDGQGNVIKQNRSNAHTLDWSGNAWFAGTVETTGVILTSPNGSKFKLKVDDNGNLSTEKI